VDVVLVSLVINNDPKTARNLSLISLEAFAYSGFLSYASSAISARARPGSGCSSCALDTASFWSGHATISATSAGLTCANHAYLPLWGNPTADAAACALASSNALFTGVARIVADRHYASDVIVGAGVGFAVGFAVPTLLHYSVGTAAEDLSFGPMPSCGRTCLGVQGRF